MDHHSEDWIPLGEVAATVDALERDRVEILGIELARVTTDEHVLLPAIADFTVSSGDQVHGTCWVRARKLLRYEIPAEATHGSFTIPAE